MNQQELTKKIWEELKAMDLCPSQCETISRTLGHNLLASVNIASRLAEAETENALVAGVSATAIEMWFRNQLNLVKDDLEKEDIHTRQEIRLTMEMGGHDTKHKAEWKVGEWCESQAYVQGVNYQECLDETLHRQKFRASQKRIS